MTPSMRRTLGALASAACVLLAVACGCRESPPPDEAKRAGRTAGSLTAADENYFHDMDGDYKPGAKPSPNAVKGRNTWMVWTGGNDRFWNQLANLTFGNFDLLKTLSSHPQLYAKRENRWSYLGLVNEPCFEQASGPDPKRFGLWLDRRVEGPGCPPDPFADAARYPGVQLGARGKTVPVGSYFGEPSGIVGLRLFPNPDFDEAAAARWNPEQYYGDPDYYLSKDLVRPYRVGMSCAFCHAGPSPTNPPPDPEHPGWQHLNSNPGAQYFWVDRIFIWDTRPRSSPGGAGPQRADAAFHASSEPGGVGANDPSYGSDRPASGYGERSSPPAQGEEPAPNERNFVYQLFHTNLPGTLDTSLVSTDYINNPRSMNAVYSMADRLGVAAQLGRERLSGSELRNAQPGSFPQTQAYAHLWDAARQIALSPRVLKDGSDSVGVLGALNRVYLNIGLYSEEWTRHFWPVVGGKKTSPIEIAVAEKNSVYWNATVAQTPDMAVFFLERAKPDRLAEAPGGASYLTRDAAQLRRGKLLFADQCAMCHSSKAPAPPPEVAAGKCEGAGAGPAYLDCWRAYWSWAQTDAFKGPMREIALADDFLDGNFLSTERRVPIDLLGTNACSALATNAIAGDIWDNFSSQSYKELPSIGALRFKHPITGETRPPMLLPGGGRGYTRPASLVSLWSTAPFLQNNSVGVFDPRPSVEGRMRSFEASIDQLLSPEKRRSDRDVIAELGLPESRAIPDLGGYMYRTTAASCVSIPAGYLPDPLRAVLGDSLQIGPIPKGTPVGLITNLKLALDPEERGDVQHGARLGAAVLELVEALKKARLTGSGCSEADLRDEEALENARRVFLEKSDVVEKLLALSKCSDFVVNRGHEFGKDLAAGDKRALIEFLKTL